ncbi:MAG: hypothetical protein WBC91_14865 [Phototrophicaceae bacterium]
MTIVYLSNNGKVNNVAVTMQLARVALNLPAVSYEPMALSPAQLDKFTGDYLVDGSQRVSILVEDDTLKMDVGNRKIEYVTIAKNQAHNSENIEMLLIFSDEVEGKYQAADVQMAMQPMRLERVDEA